MVMCRLAFFLVVLSIVAGCGRAPSSGLTDLGVAGLANAHVTLAADGERVGAAWAASGPKGTDVYAAVSVNGGRTFSHPVRVNDLEGDASANGEQPPKILLKGTVVDVLWVSKRAGVSGIRAAVSLDGGESFSAARSIAPSGLTGARGWESATLGSDDIVHAVWLDGRNSQPSPGSSTPASAGHAAPGDHAQAAGAGHRHGDMRQDIFHAMWKGMDAPVETSVASNVCFCCKTAVVTRDKDVFVAWRHLFPGGVRDIAVARSADGGATFQAPVRVSDDNWKIDACPDDGPSMAVDGDVLRVTWPTLVKDRDAERKAIFQSTSRDGGATFSPRVRVDGANASPAHPRIAAASQGRAAVVWDELAQGARRILFRKADGPAVTLSTGPAASYPAIAATADGFVVAWTDQSDGASVVRVRRVR
jgi:hypothetical protein